MELAQAPQNWPSAIEYLTQPEYSTKLKSAQLTQLQTYPTGEPTRSSLPVVELPLERARRVEIRSIQDPTHPAYNQYGLFATVSLQPDSLVIPYFGLVHSNDEDDTDADSDYDLSLNREAGLSVDANRMGNEARMANDYRGVPRPLTPLIPKKGEKLGPNSEFRDLWFKREDGTGEFGIGIFVLAAGKSGKKSAGILQGEEILVNYGKGFWKERAAQQ